MKKKKARQVKAWACVGSNGKPYVTAQAGYDRKECEGRFHIYESRKAAEVSHLGEPIIPCEIILK